jgi:hypothetical protein
MSNIYHFFNEYHIGDCLMPLRLFYSIRKVLIEKNIQIKFYYNAGYIKNFINELHRYAIPDVVELLPTSIKPANAYNTWIGVLLKGLHHTSWSEYYEVLQEDMIRYMNLQDCNINCNFLLDEPYLLDIYETIEEQYKNIDILVINSFAQSGQYTRHPQEMDELCRFLNKSYNIITTRKLEGIKCTLDADYRIQDIGAIATHAKYVVALMTGPINGITNIQTHMSVKKWFIIISSMAHYTFKYIDYNFIYDGNLQPIYDYFTRSPETPLLQESEAAHPL